MARELCIETFRGFDPRADLFHAIVVGNCLAPTIPAGTMVWFCRGAPYVEGDLIGVRVPEPLPGHHDNGYFTIKQYRRLRDPRTGHAVNALLCAKQPAAVMHPACEVIGPLVALVRMPPAFHDPCTVESDARREAVTPGTIKQLNGNGVPLIYANLSRYAANAVIDSTESRGIT